MKEAMKPTFKAVAEALLCAALISCASTAEQTGFLDGYYQNLEPGPKGGARERWLKPGVDYSKFDRVMLDSVVFYFDKNSDDAGIDPGQMKELADTFHKDLVDALKDRYPIVTEPGPGVIRYKIALTGIRQSRPVLSGVSTIIPVGLAASTQMGISPLPVLIAIAVFSAAALLTPVATPANTMILEPGGYRFSDYWKLGLPLLLLFLAVAVLWVPVVWSF